MTERLFSPVRNLFAAARTLFTGKISGESQGSGFNHEHEAFALRDEQVSLILERRMVFDETLSLLDQQIQLQPGWSFNDSLVFRELPNGYLNTAVSAGPERPIQTPISTLTTEFGEGGFGQLGVGGTVSVTG